MKETFNKYFLITIFSLTVLFTGCVPSQKEQLIGTWENENKKIEFKESEFISLNKNASKTIAFKGNYSFADNPSYAIKMIYKYAKDIEEGWFSLEETNLEGFEEFVLFRIKKDTLHLKVIGNGTLYTFKRVKTYK